MNLFEAKVGFKSRIILMWGGGVIDLIQDPHSVVSLGCFTFFLIPEMNDTSIAYNTYSYNRVRF